MPEIMSVGLLIFPCKLVASTANLKPSGIDMLLPHGRIHAQSRRRIMPMLSE